MWRKRMNRLLTPARRAVLLVLLFTLTAAAAARPSGKAAPLAGSAANGAAAPLAPDAVEKAWPDLRGSAIYNPARVPAPDPADLPHLNQPGVQSIGFTVNYNPANCPVGSLNWPGNAQAAFQRAVDIWSLLLTGPRTIEIDACWLPFPPGQAGFLGFGNTTIYYRDFDGAPLANTWYPVALANQLADDDLNGGNAEMILQFNSNAAGQNWYFGLNGTPAADEFDMVSVVLHEIGHGLGFLPNFSWDDGAAPNECGGVAGTGCYGSPPRIYDRFIQDGGGTALLNYANNSFALGNQLITDDNFWSGASGGAAQLNSPNPWVGASSLSHLDEATYNNTNHALMTPNIALGEVAHHPGTIMLGMLRDLGWTAPSLGNTYVDLTNGGFEDGTFANPFDTVIEGVLAAPNGGTVWILPGSYDESLIIDRPMTLRAWSDPITIGQ